MHLYSDISAEWYICCAGKHRLKCKRKVKKDLQTNYRNVIVCKSLPLIHCRRDEARKCGGIWRNFVESDARHAGNGAQAGLRCLYI